MTVIPSNLSEKPSHASGNISSNTLSLNSNNLGSFVLVPLSMLNIPVSSNLKVVQNTDLETQSNLLQSSFPSSETRLISPTNAKRRGPRRDAAKRKDISPGKSSRKASTMEKSNNKRDDCRAAKRKDLVKREVNPSKNNKNKLRQNLHKKSGDVLKAQYHLRKSIRQNDSTLCLVCGEKAGKHTYYGGKSCQSCRAFFRRSVHIITRLVLTFSFFYLAIYKK